VGEAKRRRAAQAAAPKPPTVALAFIHGDAGRVTSFEDSREALLGYDRANAGIITTRMPVRCGTDGLIAARNSVAAQMVASDVDWLFWVDTDMGFAPETLYQLLAVADPTERPVVGALCFAARQYAHDGLFGFRTKPQPTIYDWVVDGAGTPQFLATPMYPVNTLVQVAATGSACILIHRSVFETIAEKLGPNWYDRTPGADGKLLGEDVSFCVRAAACEIPVHVHTGVRTTHYKGQWVSEADHWRAFNPPPAREEVAVVVPVLERWRNAEPFMRSLRASTGLAHAYAVADSSDDAVIRAWEDAGATVLVDNLVTFAKKVNLGYSKTTEPWLLMVGDDVTFKPGWLDHAQHVAESLNASVIGTNDLGNPRVLAGEHATHLLIRRSYVDTVGASWDGPGIVCHESYRHWYVDDEVVTAAKQRGVWQMALGSVIEHNHPLWGKGEQDHVYELGQSHAEQDQTLFQQRCEKYLRQGPGNP
jgi:hypothetical protein